MYNGGYCHTVEVDVVLAEKRSRSDRVTVDCWRFGRNKQLGGSC